MTRVYTQNIKSTLRTVFVWAATVSALAACKPQPQEERDPDAPLVVVATTGMIGDAVKQVAGDRAVVTTLMGPGVDPHLYKATHGDLELLTRAEVVFYNGLLLEGKIGEVLDKLAARKPVIAVADGIAKERLREVEGFAGAYDPHIWFDVNLWKEAVTTVSQFLQQHDSLHREFYAVRTRAYLSTLDSLDSAVREAIATIPETQRVLITAHDAFGYFGDAYEIEVRGLQGLSTLAEFGLRDVTELVDFIIQRKIKAIFVESSVSPKSIQAVVEGCRQKGWNVAIGGSLYSDAMGEAGTPEGTYIGMMNANVRTIVESLK